MLTAIHFAASEYGWTVEHTISCPLVVLMLLMRLKLYSEKHTGITLIDKENIDLKSSGKSWEQLVEENRKMLAEQFKRRH